MANQQRCTKCSELLFPLMPQRNSEPGPLIIPWSVAENAYGAYVREYGSSQTIWRIAERGGFGWGEMDQLYPGWRLEVSRIHELEAENTKLRARIEELANDLDRIRANDVNIVMG